MKWYKLDKKYTKLYCWLVILSLLYVFPLILINVHYQDDLARTFYGSGGWSGDARPLAQYFMLLFCGGGLHSRLNDIAPLPLVMAVLILSYTLVIYAKENLQFISKNSILVLMLLTIITNPFAIQNLSYRYDCFFMFTALGIPFIIFSFPEMISKVRLFIYSLIACIAIMTLYQPAIGMCITLLIIQLFFFVIDPIKKAALSREFCRIAGIAGGAIIYMLVIAPHFIDKNESDWRYAASQTVKFNLSSIKTIFFNISNCSKYIIKNYVVEAPPLNKLVLITSVTLALGAIIIYYFRNNRKKGWKTIGGMILILCLPILVFISTFLPLTILVSLGARGRILISFGGMLFFIGIMLFYSSRSRKAIGTLAFGLLILLQYTYMYTYANALKSQNEYDKYIVYNIAHDLESLNHNGDFQSFSFIGQAPRARYVTRICDKYSFFSDIIPVYFTNSTWIGGVWVYQYLQSDLVIKEITEADQQYIDLTEPLVENSIYSVYTNSEKIIISFHENQ